MLAKPLRSLRSAASAIGHAAALCHRRLPHDPLGRAGVAAIEFALMLPVLLIIAAGLIECVNMVVLDRKVALTSQAAVDMLSRSTTIDDTDLANLRVATGLMMHPYADDFSATLVVVKYDGSGSPLIDEGPGSDGTGTGQYDIQGLDALARTELRENAEGLGLGDDQVLMVRIRATYQPVLGNLLPLRPRMATVSYMRPRPQDPVQVAATPMAAAAASGGSAGENDDGGAGGRQEGAQPDNQPTDARGDDDDD